MTQQDYTALVFVVDASGSMWSIHKDMEGAIENLLAEQRELPGKLTVDMVYFDAPTRSGGAFWNGQNYVFGGLVNDTWYQEAYHLADPADVKVNIQPRGGTALYDAVARKIDSFGLALAKLPEDERPANVLFAIVTDGEENSSVETTANALKAKVEHQTGKYNWNFTYLGANQDAVMSARAMGIAAGSSLTYNVNDVHSMTTSLSSYATATRSGIVANYTDEDRQNNA